MNQLDLEQAKIIVADSRYQLPELPFGAFQSRGDDEAYFKFSRLIMASEVPSIPEADKILRGSGDLKHLAGLHKIKYGRLKADPLRWFWTRLWAEDKFIHTVPHLRDYIGTVCETRRDKRGHPNRPYGLLFSDLPGIETSRLPWRTAEWYEARKPTRLIIEPLSEFYPYITRQPTEEHEFLLAVDALVPKGLPNHVRGDVCQDMIVAILTGETTLENLRDAPAQFVKHALKQHPSKYGHLSLDGPAGGSDTRTLGQAIGLM